VARLALEAACRRGRVVVIRLRHARAADVDAATVNAVYGRASALGEPGAARGGASGGYAPGG
jgi:hypothetical protein